MSFRSPLSGLAILGAASGMLCSQALAGVDCWAPGMGAPVTLTETVRNRNAVIVKPYRYDIYGIAGNLKLGNKAVNAEVVDGVYRLKLLGLLGLGTPVDSTAYVQLQTGLTKFYPQVLTVKSKTVGAAYGPVYQYGERWTLADPKNPVNANLTFHLPGSNLLAALLAAPPNYNLNPEGYFYVLGEYHAAPPVMTGTLTVPAQTVLVGTATSVSYSINRYQAPIYRPPFLGLDLGDINLTILGTPPLGTPSNPGPGGVPAGPPPASLLSVAIDLSANSGSGWLKIKLF